MAAVSRTQERPCAVRGESKAVELGGAGAPHPPARDPVRSYQSRPTALVRNSEKGAAVRQASV